RIKALALFGQQKVPEVCWFKLKKLGFRAEHGRKMKGQIYPTISSTNSSFLCRDVTCNVPTFSPGKC
ncbi:MAG: hypothetical protein O4859_07240, partial [Trichodesmium sp. St18_bin1]|nr:hypothetical protein [Trichodesmium sp. St18_bin1]